MRDREMKESGGGGNQLFDSRIAMDKPPDISNSDGITNFEFAFNDSNFSDRVLRIEITAEMPGVSTRSLERDKKEEDFTSCTAEVITINDKPDLEDNMIYGGHDGESTLKIDESPSADEAERKGDSSWGLCCSTVLKVKSLYVSSAILAAESPFFYKLFSNGMLESDQRQATLQIHESEETAVMDLLSYIYSKKLSSTTVTELLDVLMTADKFEVSSCIRHCSELLCKLPMTLEYALRYLDLPCSVSMASELKSLTDIAKKCLATHYKDITKEEVLQLPLVGIEAILSSETLQVSNEDQVYDFVLKWAQTQYPKGEERRSVLNSLLAQVVHFPYMTCRRLKKALVSNEFDRELASKLVLEALFFKAESSHKQRFLASDSSTNRQYIERPYKYRPVKLVEFESPYQQCIVYLDLKREECANLFPSGRVYSQAFHLAGQGFFLSAHCNIDQQSSTECFGLFLGMQDKAGAKLAVDYEFASRMMPTGEFVNKYKGQYLFTGGKAVGYRNLFAVPWTYFMNEDSPYFINGTLHLRAEMTARQRSLNSANQN